MRRPAQDGEIRNSGAIRAAEVELRANGGNIYALAGNTGRAIWRQASPARAGNFSHGRGRFGQRDAEGRGTARASERGARRRAGDYRPARSFTGGDVVVSGDKVVVGGAIEAKGNGGAGGTVVVTGKDVTLTSTAAIDASGTSGGTVLIGGDRAGGSDAALKFLPQTIANAQNTTIEAGATITADGISGAGGNVVVGRTARRRLPAPSAPRGCAAASSRPRGMCSTSPAAASMPAVAVHGCWTRGSDDRCDARRHHRDRVNGGSNVTQQTTRPAPAATATSRWPAASAGRPMRR